MIYACRVCLRRSLPFRVGATLRAIQHLQLRSPSLPSPRTFAATPSLSTFFGDASGPGGTIHDPAQLSSLDHSIKDKKRLQKLRFAVEKHLEHLRDPWNIAQHVERTLRQTGDSRFDEILLLVQTASKSTSITVSWNHLIDHHLKLKRLRPAIKLFNEMKKRGQKPNQQTYTIIFRGCADNPHKDLALAEAVRIYNAMSRDGAVRPNIIHANAVLLVCVQAGDMDAMFAFLDKMEEDRQLRLDAPTYSTILQGMRQQLEAVEDPAKLSTPAERQRASDQILSRCHIVWGEIIRKWRKGALRVDESLVATMGRLLLRGNVECQKDVFALLSQTLRLPRLDHTDAAVGKIASASAGYSVVYKPFDIPEKMRINPGTRTLDLILLAAIKMRFVKAGLRYWHYYVDELGISPDQEIWKKLIKLLHVGSSSNETARFLKTMPASYITSYDLRTAFSTCLRNMQNPSVFANAQDILNVALRDALDGPPDVKSLWLFLQVANGRVPTVSRDRQERWHVFCQEAAVALDSMWKPYERAADDVLLPQLVSERNIPYEGENRISQLCEVIDVARGMISLTGKIIDNVDKQTRSVLEDRRRNLNRQVVVFTELQGESLRQPGRQVRFAKD